MINFERHSERHRKVAGKEILIRYWQGGGGILHPERCQTQTGWPEGCILQDNEKLTGRGPEQFDLTLKSALLLQRFGPDDLQRSVPTQEKSKSGNV